MNPQNDGKVSAGNTALTTRIVAKYARMKQEKINQHNKQIAEEQQR